MHEPRRFAVGQHVSWHIRPEVHADHGGYLNTLPLAGTVRSVHDGFIMVGTGKMLLPHVLDPPGTLPREQTFAVSISNQSLTRKEVL